MYNTTERDIIHTHDVATVNEKVKMMCKKDAQVVINNDHQLIAEFPLTLRVIMHLKMVNS